MLWDPLVATVGVAWQWGLLSLKWPRQEALAGNQRIEYGIGKITQLA